MLCKTFCYLCVKEKEIIKIQAFLKANKARDDYRTLSESNKHFTLLQLQLSCNYDDMGQGNVWEFDHAYVLTFHQINVFLVFK